MPKQFPLIETVPVSLRFPGARPFQLKVFSVNKPELNAYLQEANYSAEIARAGVGENSVRGVPTFSSTK